MSLLYIDPGSGSFLLQAIIGGVLAVGVFFKSIRHQVVSFFSRKKSAATEDQGESRS